MIKKTVTYEDFNGEKKTKELWFHFSESEITNEELTTEGGLYNTIRKMTEEQDRIMLAKLFRQIILKSYGEKSADGERFMKSQEIMDNFEHSAAYDALYMELATDTQKVSDFVKGTLPKNLAARVDEELAKNPQLTLPEV